MRRSISAFLMTLALASTVSAQMGTDIYTQEARKIVERLSGTKVPSDHPLLIEAATALRNGDRLAAAQAGTKHPNFLNSTVKQMALKMSTREETLSLVLNDFAASFIGVTRDNLDARLLLTGNLHYVADETKYRAQMSVGLNQTQISAIKFSTENPTGDDSFKFVKSNDHYSQLENSKVDIGSVLLRRNNQKILGQRVSHYVCRSTDSKGNLVDEGTCVVVGEIIQASPAPVCRNKTTKSVVTCASILLNPVHEEFVTTNPDAAGVLTSRTFMTEHADAGTNRRLVEFAFREFMCAPLEDWADASASDAWIGRDIDRFPGGDHQKFSTSCKSCHSVMDAFRPAFAKWHFSGGVVRNSARRVGDNSFDAQGVAKKMNHNEKTFLGGYVIKSDEFVNNANGAANAAFFGWRGPSSGQSVNGFGQALANSERFSKCMVKRVYDAACRTNLDLKSDVKLVETLAQNFEKRNYNLRELFEQVAIQPSCLGVK